MERRARGHRGDDKGEWDFASGTFIPKTSRPTTASQWRPITSASNLENLDELTLLSKAEQTSEERLRRALWGYRAGKQQHDVYMTFKIHKVHARAQAKDEDQGVRQHGP